HSITVGGTAVSYTASFSRQYQVSVTASPAGVGYAYVSPQSSDGFYNAGTVLSLTASPAQGACFSGWTGLLSGAGASTTLTVNQAYALTANFTPGGGSGVGSVSPGFVFEPASGGSVPISVYSGGGCGGIAVSSAFPWLQPVRNGSSVTLNVLPNSDSFRFGWA